MRWHDCKDGQALKTALLPCLFCTRGLFVFSSQIFVLSLSDLLFDFLGDQVDGGVEVIFNVFCKKVGTRESQAKRTGELLLGRLGFVMFKSDSSIDGIAIQMRQLLYFADDVIFDGLGEGYIVRRKDQVHELTMGSECNKIQRKCTVARMLE